MKIAIVGGKLQGIEAAYLSHKADWKVILIDKNAQAPAVGMADSFYQLDITKNEPRLLEILASADLVIPATENPYAISDLEDISSNCNITLAHDAAAYRISSSKKKPICYCPASAFKYRGYGRIVIFRLS